MKFAAEIAEGFDSDVAPELASSISSNLQSGGFSTIVDADADYSHSGKRLRLAGNATTAFRYYQSLDRIDALGHSAGLGASVTLPKGGNLRIDQGAAYSPSYLYQLFPVDNSALGEPIPANPDYQIAQTDSYSYNTRLALSFGSARGTRVTTSGTFSRTDYQNQAATSADLDTYEAGVEIAHHVTRGGLSAAYGLRSGEFGAGGATKEHRLTVGVEYSPALSRTRRATFRVELTPTQLDTPLLVQDATVGGQVSEKQFRLSAEASAGYPFRPNWRTTVRYRRDVEYLSVLGQPVFSDAARFELAGLLARRVDVGLSAGYATAGSVVDQAAQALETYTGQVAIRYALKRSIGLYSEYLYYYYDQRGQNQLAPGLPTVFEQHGIRFGVALFIEPFGR